jgi:hypothetical protein
MASIAHPSKRSALAGRLAELAAEVRDMAERVISNGAEPNYAGEKMGRAARCTIEALAVIDALYIEKWDGAPPYDDLEHDHRTNEIKDDAGRAYSRERQSWETT